MDRSQGGYSHARKMGWLCQDNQPAWTGTGWICPSFMYNNSDIGLFFFFQLRAPRIPSALWSLVDVSQAWEDVTTPAKHSQRALGFISQQECNKNSREQRWGHTPWRPQGLPDQPIHGSTEVGGQNNPLPTLTTAATVHSDLDDPLPAMVVSMVFRAQMIEGGIHNRYRPAGAHGQQLKGPGLNPATGTAGGKLVESGLHESSKVGHPCLQIKQGQTAEKLIVRSASLSLAAVPSCINWGLQDMVPCETLVYGVEVHKWR